VCRGGGTELGGGRRLGPQDLAGLAQRLSGSGVLAARVGLPSRAAARIGPGQQRAWLTPAHGLRDGARFERGLADLARARRELGERASA